MPILSCPTYKLQGLSHHCNSGSGILQKGYFGIYCYFFDDPCLYDAKYFNFSGIEVSREVDALRRIINSFKCHILIFLQKKYYLFSAKCYVFSSG